MTFIALTVRTARALISACLFIAAAVGPHTATAEAVSDRVKATGTLRACIWPEYHGVTFRDPRNQRLSGIDIELSAQFSQDLHVRLEYVDSSFATLIDDV